MKIRDLLAATILSTLVGVWLAQDPGMATGVTTEVISGTISGPTTAGTSVTAMALCPTATKLVGGGIRVFLTEDGTPPNSLKVNGTVPSNSNNGAPASDGTQDPPLWTGIGGAGGQSVTGAETSSYAICATDGPTDTVVEVESVNGPTAAGTSTEVTATCPTGTRLVGGGAMTTPASSGGLKTIGSFPSDSSGNPAEDGAENPNSWTAVGLTGGAGSTNTTAAFAVCDEDETVETQIVVTEELDDPEPASTSNSVTATCPENKVLLGGGVNANLDGGTPQQGVHLTGSFPSDSGGAPVGSGSAGSWTGVVQTGGQEAPGTDSHAFAVCGT